MASRLEQLTREIGTSLVVSNELICAVHARGADPLDLVPDLRRKQDRKVRGRHEPVAIWCAGEIEPTPVPH